MLVESNRGVDYYPAAVVMAYILICSAMIALVGIVRGMLIITAMALVVGAIYILAPLLGDNQ